MVQRIELVVTKCVQQVQSGDMGCYTSSLVNCSSYCDDQLLNLKFISPLFIVVCYYKLLYL